MLAIDPGPTQSAILSYDGDRPYDFGIYPNDDVLEILDDAYKETSSAFLVIEMVESYGMPVGKDVFETVLWIGRFMQQWRGLSRLLGRKEVKLHLCHSARAKDANVRQALLDKFPAAGGGKTPQVGTKGQPGPLYGISSHLWSALAVAVTWWETRERE